MTPEKQRIAIAEACGRWPLSWPYSHMNQTDRLRYVPDYLNDLNAMHQTEEVLTYQQWPDYWNWLFVASTRQSGTGKAEYKVAHATAAQRAEAFLRTIGKWEEST